MKLHFFNSSLTLLGLVAITACTDNKYDLSNIDMTMHIGSGTLTLPACSTDSIYLGSLFDLTNDGPLRKLADPQNPNDSIFYLDVEGSANPSDIKIDDIVIPSPQPNAINADMILARNSNPQQAKRVMRRAEGNLPSSKPLFQYNIQDDATYDITTRTTTPITDDIDDIRYIGFNPVAYTLRIKLSDEKNNLDIINNLHFDSLSITLPKGFNVLSCEYGSVGNTHPINVDNAYNGEIIINRSFDKDGYHPIGNPLELTLVIAGATLSDINDINFFTENNKKHAKVEGKIQLHGCAKIYKEDIDTTLLASRYQVALEARYKDEYKDDLASSDPLVVATTMQTIATEITKKMADLSNGEYYDAIYTLLRKIHIDGPNGFYDLQFIHNNDYSRHPLDFVVTMFNGSLHHNIDALDPIDLDKDNLPDFLRDNDVTFSLGNPQVFLKIFTGIPATIRTGFQMVPYVDNETKSIIAIDNIEYDGTRNDTLVLCIAKNKSAITWPEEYSTYKYRDSIQVDNLHTLITEIPDSIVIKSQDGSSKIVVDIDDCENLSLSQDYEVKFAYKVFNPITFGEGFKIVYADEDRGWNIADDLDDFDVDTLELTARVYSDIPLSLKLKADPMPATGNDPIQGITIQYKNSNETRFQNTGLNIAANAAGEEICLRIVATNGSLQLLDGLKYRAEVSEPATDNQAQVLRHKSSLRIDSVRLSIVGGVTIKDNN